MLLVYDFVAAPAPHKKQLLKGGLDFAFKHRNLGERVYGSVHNLHPCKDSIKLGINIGRILGEKS